MIHHSATFLIQTFSLLEPQNESLPPHLRHLVLERLFPSAGRLWWYPQATSSSEEIWERTSVQLLKCVRLFAAHGPQHARPPCPSSTPGVYSNSSALSQWCNPTISSSVIPFSSCPQSSEHQGLSQWVSSSHQVANVLELLLQHEHPDLISLRMDL